MKGPPPRAILRCRPAAGLADVTPSSWARNARFAVPAAEPGSAFIPYVGRPIEDILCIQEDRTVGADNCVTWNRRSLQIPPQHHRQHYVRATVRVHQYPDGRLAIFDGPRCLARFDPPERKPDARSQAA